MVNFYENLNKPNKILHTFTCAEVIDVKTGEVEPKNKYEILKIQIEVIKARLENRNNYNHIVDEAIAADEEELSAITEEMKRYLGAEGNSFLIQAKADGVTVAADISPIVLKDVLPVGIGEIIP